MMNDQATIKFVSLMSELFQLKESETIDYGIYKIIRSHNQRIADFLGTVDGDNLTSSRMSQIIDDVLSISPNAKQEVLQELFSILAESGINQEDCTIGKTTNIKQCVDKAIASNNPSVPKQKQEINRIQAAYEAYKALDQAQERKSVIFTKLYEFYNANYEEGDFITQRSYGDGSNSVMRYTPSSGGDVEFSWATQGMYYIKSGDVFADYPVKLPSGKTLTICMNAEQLNETRAMLGVNDKAVYTFNDQDLTQDEQGNWTLTLGYVKKTKGVKESDAVLEKAMVIATQTGSTEEEIKRALRRYIKRNQSDFFIHQNLKQELDTNLEFFVKNRLMVDTTTLLNGSAQDIKKHLETAQAVLTIGKEINAFLGELEGFQKTLWERKKLVLSTNYVITLDKMHEYCGDDFGALLNEVLANDKQITEWKELNLGSYGAIEIKSIAHVINLIGMKRTYELALAAAIKSFPQKSTLFRSIIDFSADVAIACAEIAGYVHGVAIEDAYLFGLFKEGGAIGLAATLDHQYEKHWESLMTFPETGIQLEYQALNARHDYLGVAVARHWGFGKSEGDVEILYAIQEHHNHEQVASFANERARLLVAIGLLADALVSEIVAERYMATEALTVKEKAVDVLMLPDDIVSLIRKNISSALISKS